MNTPAHLILNLAGLGSGPRRDLAGPILAGALLPDAPMFLFFVWESALVGASQAQIWGELYFQPGWQLFFDWFNSIPLAGVGLIGAWRLGRRGATAFCASWLMHCLCDLPVHREDAHRHFLPVSTWSFESPVSYWDPAHYGAAFSTFETLLVLAGSVVLWRRYPRPWARIAVGLVTAMYVAGGVAYITVLL